MKKFKMKDLEDIPNHPAIPKNVKLLHTNNKQLIFDTIMDAVVGDIFLPYENEVCFFEKDLFNSVFKNK